MANPKEELLKVLDDLRDDEFKKFKWLLKLNNEGSIAAAKLEKADRQDTVDMMTETYGNIDDAIKETMKVLKKNNRNDLVNSLEELLEDLEEEEEEEEEDEDYARYERWD